MGQWLLTGLFKLILLSFYLLTANSENSQLQITTLTKFQKSEHVFVIQVEELVFDSLFWRVKILDIWTKNKLQADVFYTANVPENSKGKIFIGTYGPERTMEEHLIAHTQTGIGTEDYFRSVKNLLKTLDSKEKARFYMHPWYYFPVLENENEELYIPECRDGLSKKPIVNPLLKQVKELSLPKIDDRPKVAVVGFFWPAGETDEGLLKVRRCGDKDSNILHWIKNIF